MSTPTTISNYADATGTTASNSYTNIFPLYPKLNYATGAITTSVAAEALAWDSTNSIRFGGYKCIRYGLVFAFPQHIDGSGAVA